MSFEFLMPDAARPDERFAPIARSPMERQAKAAGASFELRDGWNVATAYGDPEAERRAIEQTAAWADVSHLGKLELQGEPGALEQVASHLGAELELGRASRTDERTWWCPLTRTRALVLTGSGELPELRGKAREAAASAPSRISLVDVSTSHAALTLIGPLARETFARFSALDLRPHVTPPASVRPGSIARQPGILVCEAPDRYLFLFGWGLGEYMWTTVADACERLGGRPVGVDALPPLGTHQPLEQAHA